MFDTEWVLAHKIIVGSTIGGIIAMVQRHKESPCTFKKFGRCVVLLLSTIASVVISSEISTWIVETYNFHGLHIVIATLVSVFSINVFLAINEVITRETLKMIFRKLLVDYFHIKSEKLKNAKEDKDDSEFNIK